MPRKTKQEKLVEAEVDRLYIKLASGVQFEIMDLTHVLNAGRTAGMKGENIEEAMTAAIAKYRKN